MTTIDRSYHDNFATRAVERLSHRGDDSLNLQKATTRRDRHKTILAPSPATEFRYQLERFAYACSVADDEEDFPKIEWLSSPEDPLDIVTTREVQDRSHYSSNRSPLPNDLEQGMHYLKRCNAFQRDLSELGDASSKNLVQHECAPGSPRGLRRLAPPPHGSAQRHPGLFRVSYEVCRDG